MARLKPPFRPDLSPVLALDSVLRIDKINLNSNAKNPHFLPFFGVVLPAFGRVLAEFAKIWHAFFGAILGPFGRTNRISLLFATNLSSATPGE